MRNHTYLLIFNKINSQNGMIFYAEKSDHTNTDKTNWQLTTSLKYDIVNSQLLCHGSIIDALMVFGRFPAERNESLSLFFSHNSDIQQLIVITVFLFFPGLLIGVSCRSLEASFLRYLRYLLYIASESRWTQNSIMPGLVYTLDYDTLYFSFNFLFSLLVG